MKSLVHLTGLTKDEIYEIFKLADINTYSEFFRNKTAALFFPNSSLRTRITFEKAIFELGGQSILFPPETLDKKEDLKDVCGYLENWADLIIVRHSKIEIVEKLSDNLNIPVINAMTAENHPCEIITDLYSFSKIRENYLGDKYLFCGTNGNIGKTWKTASEIMGFDFSQCCPKGYEIDGAKVYHNLDEAVIGKDIICTDSIPSKFSSDFKGYQITKSVMEKANHSAVLNPCPPFFRGEEVSENVINSKYFVGYGFKKHLFEVQKAIIAFCLLK